jgi:hypothetical protein
VPLDMAELVARLLRRLLPAEIQVSTETGRGTNGGPPSMPWLLVAEDGHTWAWPAVQQATIRLTCWHRSDHAAKAAAGLALGVLCDPHSASGADAFLSAEPVTAPLAATDPYTGAPIATATASVLARTPARR